MESKARQGPHSLRVKGCSRGSKSSKLTSLDHRLAYLVTMPSRKSLILPKSPLRTQASKLARAPQIMRC
jgi:hypothetical protein